MVSRRIREAATSQIEENKVANRQRQSNKKQAKSAERQSAKKLQNRRNKKEKKTLKAKSRKNQNNKRPRSQEKNKKRNGASTSGSNDCPKVNTSSTIEVAPKKYKFELNINIKRWLL